MVIWVCTVFKKFYQEARERSEGKYRRSLKERPVLGPEGW